MGLDMTRLQELKIELENERISYGELAELDQLAMDNNITITDDMFAMDIIVELERKGA